ncbi:hypothetical protein SO694_00145064 [Aureococcus anophagefferens]|uniref:Uncharacterized protein n=1 Tax=Aureococcus anophagefferens TaxID=44056 RepID=A0ABR1FPP4_AURAN
MDWLRKDDDEASEIHMWPLRRAAPCACPQDAASRQDSASLASGSLAESGSFAVDAARPATPDAAPSWERGTATPSGRRPTTAPCSTRWARARWRRSRGTGATSSRGTTPGTSRRALQKENLETAEGKGRRDAVRTDWGKVVDMRDHYEQPRRGATATTRARSTRATAASSLDGDGRRHAPTTRQLTLSPSNADTSAKRSALEAFSVSAAEGALTCRARWAVALADGLLDGANAPGDATARRRRDAPRLGRRRRRGLRGRGRGRDLGLGARAAAGRAARRLEASTLLLERSSLPGTEATLFVDRPSTLRSGSGSPTLGSSRDDLSSGSPDEALASPEASQPPLDASPFAAVAEDRASRVAELQRGPARQRWILADDAAAGLGAGDAFVVVGADADAWLLAGGHWVPRAGEGRCMEWHERAPGDDLVEESLFLDRSVVTVASAHDGGAPAPAPPGPGAPRVGRARRSLAGLSELRSLAEDHFDDLESHFDDLGSVASREHRPVRDDWAIFDRSAAVATESRERDRAPPPSPRRRRSPSP